MGLSETELSREATGRDAALLLKRAVDVLEPALPPLQQAAFDLPVLPEDSSFETVNSLSEWGLLPVLWTPDALTKETWREMLSGVAAWYGLEPDTFVPDTLTTGALAEGLASLIEEVAPTLDPVALVASTSEDRDRIAFWGVIRNRTVYPRVIVFRPPAEGATLQEGVQSVLPALETCAIRLERFVFAPADTAERLFLANSNARMVIVQTEPGVPYDLHYVPVGEETAYFTYRDETLEGVERYAAVFAGPAIGAAALLRIIPQLRTNMNPREIIEFVRDP